jgi:DNA repair exonuclease SbcCD ATPase subunit
MQTDTTKREIERNRAYTHTHTNTTKDKREREKDEFITVERRGIEYRARMRKLCLINDEIFCRKIYIYRNILIK